MARYVALLRGINVGGKNIIKMADLKACFEDLGFEAVSTYIQSGNVLFDAARVARVKLVQRIEQGLAKAFDYDATVVLRSHAQLEKVIDSAPKGYGKSPKRFRYDVIFLKEPLRAATAIKSVDTRAGVDTAHAGPGVLYFSRVAAKASQSRLSKLSSSTIYPSVTVRNWNTTTKLLELL